MNKTKNSKRGYTAPALEKGLEILELLSEEVDGLSLTAIAEKLDRSVGQIFRMMFVLEQRGYLTIDPATDTYKLSFRLFEIAHRHTPIKRLSAAAGPVMRALARRIRQSLHVAVYYRGRCIVMVQEASPGPMGFNVRLGSEIQLLHSCSGNILLAFSEDQEREHMLSETSAENGKRIGKRKLQSTLAAVRERGFESIDSTITSGVKDVGFPVYDFNGLVVAALTCPFLECIDGSNPVDLAETTHLLGDAAKAISRGLGHLDSK